MLKKICSIQVYAVEDVTDSGHRMSNGYANDRHYMSKKHTDSKLTVITLLVIRNVV
jgi:hypothetical protein